MTRSELEICLIKELSNIMNKEYGFLRAELEKISFEQNFVLLGKNPSSNVDIVVRVSPDLHKNKKEIEAELHFIESLKKGGVSTVKPISAKSGNFVVTFKVDGFKYHLVVFEKIQGQIIKPEDFDSNILEILGCTIAKMHVLSKRLAKQKERQDWYGEEYLKSEKYLPGKKYDLLRNKITDIIQEVKLLPQTINTYGLIHSDIHHNNFFVNSSEITIFDFEDCEYHYFISDFASVLHEELDCYKGESKKIFAEFFTKCFWKGYLQENKIDTLFIEKIPLFIKLRDALMLLMSFDSGATKQSQFFNEAKERLEKDIPYVNLNFRKIIDHLV